jgi:multicomponent Na+:H+ antiporter subunit D
MLSFFVTIPIIVAVFLFILPLKKTARIIAAAAQAALFGFAFYVFLLCKDGDIVTRVGNYEGFLGIILKADNLTSVFLMLTSFIFLVVTIYCFNENFSRLFWFFLFVWQGLLNGVFLSNDMFNIFVLVEVATVVVAALIMYNRDNRSMYDGMVYLMINIVAMQFYLFGVGYLYKLTGTLDMTAAAQAIGHLEKSSLVLPYGLIITAISLKCALTPLFTWLPKAYTPSTPSGVTAILSAVHAKVGIFLFIRFQTLFAEIMITEFFLLIGVITGIVGAVFALSQTDVRLILAYSTISQIGLIMVGLNVSDIHFYTGGVYHIFNHALFKSALFLCAGIITHAYGTRDVTQIRDVLRRYPLVGAATIMAILGIIGTPFFNGSISKYFITSDSEWLIRGPILLINLGTIIVFIKYSTMLFGTQWDNRLLRLLRMPINVSSIQRRGQQCEENAISADSLSDTHVDAHVSTPCDGADVVKTGEPPPSVPVSQQVAILSLGILCLAGGIFGEQFVEFLFNVEVNVDAAGYVEKTGLFALSVVIGYLIYRYLVDRHPFFKRIRGFDMSFRWMCGSIGGFFAVMLIIVRLFAV